MKFQNSQTSFSHVACLFVFNVCLPRGSIVYVASLIMKNRDSVTILD